MAPVPNQFHSGRHRNLYHERVFIFLKRKLAGKYGDEATKALYAAMDELRQLILNNPSQWFDP
jgi:hypothetical protein